MRTFILLASYTIFTIGVLSFLSYASAEPVLISDCQRTETKQMYGTQWIIVTSLDCDVGNGIIQHGLTELERSTLADLAIAKLSPDYELPPIDTTVYASQINPLCDIVHYSYYLKNVYGCFD